MLGVESETLLQEAETSHAAILPLVQPDVFYWCMLLWHLMSSSQGCLCQSSKGLGYIQHIKPLDTICTHDIEPRFETH